MSPGAVERARLPDERNSRTLALRIGGKSFYVVIGHYEDGSPGELFIYAGRGGPQEQILIDAAPLLDALALAISLGLQRGVPLADFLHKFKGTRFEPSGFTGDPRLPRASSVLDLVARRVAQEEGIDLDGPVTTPGPVVAPLDERPDGPVAP